VLIACFRSGRYSADLYLNDTGNTACRLEDPNALIFAAYKTTRRLNNLGRPGTGGARTLRQLSEWQAARGYGPMVFSSD